MAARIAFILISVALIINLQSSHSIATKEPSFLLEKKLKVHFLDVGQGDCILIETPEGKNILVDGGPPAAGEKVVTYLKNRGITTLHLLVATHPDIDHIGGLIRVIEETNVEKIIDSGKFYNTNTYYTYLEKIREKKIPVSIVAQEKKIYSNPNLTLKAWKSKREFKTNNQSALVLSLNYGQIDFLLMGDVEKEQEKEFIAQQNQVTEILKVGHHGSETSTALEFLQEIRPEIAVLSYSQNNEYGHPVDRIIDHLQLVRATIYSTAKAGDIVIATDGKSYEVYVTGKDRVIMGETGKMNSKN